MNMRISNCLWVGKVAALRLVGFVVALTAGTANAQLAPVAGAHYAVNSGTGFQSSTNSSGGYSTSVPMDLPAARDGLPVPVQVSYGEKQIGAAGMGWDVPLSFISRNNTTAYSRPAPQAAGQSTPLRARESLSLTLDGARVDLVRNAANTAWVARRGGSQVEVRAGADGIMLMYDGEGRTYSFSSQSPLVGGRLVDGNLYLLKSITSTGGNRVELGYSITAPALSGGGSGLAINLVSVAYNLNPSTANCFKHKVFLTYDAALTLPSPPISMSVLNGAVLVRVQKLVAISVKSKETCALSEKTLATYNFAYAADLDTKQPRLRSVTMTGQQNTPEQYVTLPIAAYSYGSIVDPTTNAVTYEKVQSTGPNNIGSIYSNGLSYTAAKKISYGLKSFDGIHLETHQSLMDFNGDGRIDLLDSNRQIHINSPGTNRNIQYSETGSIVPLFQKTRAQHFGVQYQNSRGQRNRSSSVDDIYTQYIDMNGDGRIDIVDAGDSPEDPDVDHTYWIVYINAPDALDPSKSNFIVRKIPTARIRDALLARGIAFSGAVPLARTTTVPETLIAYCWSNREDMNGNMRWIGDPSGAGCPGAPAVNTRKKTIKEFELKDVNGDGYPDFIYNASYVNVEIRNEPPPPNYPAPPLIPTVHVLTTLPSDISGSRDIMALINTAGVHFYETEELFSRPITLEAGGTTGCGIGRWEVDVTSAVNGEKMAETCGLQDVNGDGIADRVTTVGGVTNARLGTGDMNRPFATAGITLPGPLTRTATSLTTFYEYPGLAVPTQCYSGTTSDTTSWSVLQDISGDGIPDYLSIVAGVATAAMGTGTDFAPPVSIISPFGAGLPLMLERNQCASSVIGAEPVLTSATPSGFYDLDGDGQLEIVAMNAAQTTWDIFQLKAPLAQLDVTPGIASVPAAGRLTKIENGYGASTTIGYRSAKEDKSTGHDVPFPEIVVESIGTKDSANASLVATTRYAYRGAKMIYDAAYDAFRFPGYIRSVSLQNSEDVSAPEDGTASITDNFSLEPFAASMGATLRFKRYMKAGLTRSVTTLSGSVGNNPWSLLAVDINTDARRTSGKSYDWEAKLLPTGAAPVGNEQCIDMMFPYDYATSRNNAVSPTDDACTQHGFMFQKLSFSWRGRPGTENVLTSPNTVQASSTVEAIDDYERVTRATSDGDLFDSSDNICTLTEYATPSGINERILKAPALQTMTTCGAGALTLSQTRWEYDTSSTGTKLPAGQVSKGFLTAQIVSRRNTQTGAPIVDAKGSSDIRVFDIAYDSSGNPTRISKIRDDGASLVVGITYDDFGLVPLSTTVDATNANGSKPPMLLSSNTFDQSTLNALTSTDANGMMRSNTYDGFGRVLLSKVKPVGSTEGVLTSNTYSGFAVGQASGRSVAKKAFTNPVPVANLATAVGRVDTVFLDSLGREQYSEAALGTDYANKKMIVGKRIYDQLGRVKFEADPFPSLDSFSTAYGTTYYFNADGTPAVSIRGYGQQPRNILTSEAAELFSTSYNNEFQGNSEIVSVQGPEFRTALSPREDIEYKSRLTALGRVRERWTGKSGLLSRIEFATFSYDPFGQLTRMDRYRDAATATSAVTTRWSYDSMGRLLTLDESGSATQNRSYDTWGDLTQVQWIDATIGGDRRNVMQYDALGRLVRSEDRTGGVVDVDTVNTYLYDTGVNTITPSVIATNVLGRMAKANSPTSTVSFSYDGLGRINARTYTDISISPAKVYVEMHETNGDGSPKSLSMLLPDNAFKVEKVDYAYDSAGRTRSVKYNDGVNRDLFTTAGSNDLDVFGRIRQAKYGVNTYTATYADVGRRLLASVKVVSPAGKSREIAFPTLNGLPAFDPAGRERIRRESKDGVVSPFDATSIYDSLGRLQLASLSSATGTAGVQPDRRAYTYDALGNIVQQTTLDSLGQPTATSNNVTLTYDSIDRDRICSVGYGATTPPAVCNIKYDGVGNIIEMPTRDSGIRRLTYFANGQTKSITNGATVANYRYDAFGAVQQLTLDSISSADTRRDKSFGSMLIQRTENGISVLTRSIPGPGMIATRHGPTGEWTFTFGEQSGNRFVTDQSGTFVQDMAYAPFGERDAALSGGALPGSTKYSNAQWNGGDALSALGISQLGARMYDPVIGRFLSRDPLILPRTSTTTNPYAFADNDPVNSSDPSGLTTETRIEDGWKPKKCESGCNRGSPSAPGGAGIPGPGIEGPVALPAGPNPPPPPASNGGDYGSGIPSPQANPTSSNGDAGGGSVHGSNGGFFSSPGTLAGPVDYGYDERDKTSNTPEARAEFEILEAGPPPPNYNWAALEVDEHVNHRAHHVTLILEGAEMAIHAKHLRSLFKMAKVLKGAAVVGNIIVVGGQLYMVLDDPSAENVVNLGFSAAEIALLSAGPYGVVCVCAIEVAKYAWSMESAPEPPSINLKNVKFYALKPSHFPFEGRFKAVPIQR